MVEESRRSKERVAALVRESLPREEEAGCIFVDGCNEVRVWWAIERTCAGTEVEMPNAYVGISQAGKGDFRRQTKRKLNRRSGGILNNKLKTKLNYHVN